MSEEDTTQLLNRLSEITSELCSDYPDIENVDPWEQLYALEQSHRGALLACDDLTSMIQILQVQCGMTTSELSQFFTDEKKRSDAKLLIELTKPAVEYGIYLHAKNDVEFSINLNTGAKSECVLKVVDDKIVAFRRYDREDVVKDFYHLLELVHGCGHGRSFFSHKWEEMLIEYGFETPRGEL